MIMHQLGDLFVCAIAGVCIWAYRREAHFAWAAQGRAIERAQLAEDELQDIKEGQHMARINLGDKARHAITGFEGIAVATVKYLTGCDQVCLQPQGLDDKGQPFESRYFDEPYVDLVQEGAVPNRTPGRLTGCDIAPPSRRG